MESKEINVVLYIRTCSDDKSQLQKQKQELIKYCESKDYRIKKIFKDFNCKGLIINPELLELETYVSNNNIDRVIVCNIDRISINLKTALQFFEILEKNNCKIEITYTYKELEKEFSTTNNNESVVLYVAEKDDEEELLEQQKSRLRKYCEIMKYKIEDLYSDFNYGLKNDKTQFKRLLDDVDSKNIKKIILCDIDLIKEDFCDMYCKFFDKGCLYEDLKDFNTLSYIGKTPTSLFTFFKDV